MNRRAFLLSLAAPPAGPLPAHWPLETDARDVSGNNLHGAPYGARFRGQGAEFDGRASRIEIPASPAINLGTDDFTIAAELDLESDLDDIAGGILMKYDPARRPGAGAGDSRQCRDDNAGQFPQSPFRHRRRPRQHRMG